MKIYKQYNGYTGHKLIKDAIVGLSDAGAHEVCPATGCGFLYLTEDNYLRVCTSEGSKILHISKRDAKKLYLLTTLAIAANLTIIIAANVAAEKKPSTYIGD